MIEIIFGDWCKINLDERKYLLNLYLMACILFGTTVLEKKVVKMSPIEWVLVILIFISSGVTIWTLIVY